MSVGRRLALGAALAVLAVLVAVVWLVASGYRAYVVHTGSMDPTYPPGTLVIDRPPGQLHAGEVITFHHSARGSDVVTHRITDLTPTGLIHTKGDGNGSADVWDIRPDQVVGRVVGSIPYGGYVAVYVQQPAGVASVVTVALSLGLLWSFFFPGRKPQPEMPTEADEVDRANDAPALSVTRLA